MLGFSKARVFRSLIVGMASWPTLALAQTASESVKPIVPPVACDSQAVVLRVLALERSAPGQLTMEVDYESAANVPQTIRLGSRKTALVDNTGYQYKVSKSPKDTRLMPGGKTRASYVFLTEVGGQKATTVSMDISFSVRTDKGNHDCGFVIPGIPIAEVNR